MTEDLRPQLPVDLVGRRARFRRVEGGRWRLATLRGLERDGSLSLSDTAKGAARAIPADQVQLETRGPRGGKNWTPASEVLDGC